MDKSDNQEANTDTADDATPLPQITDVKLSIEEANLLTEFINSKASSANDECSVCGSPKNFVSEYVWKMETQKTEAAFGGRFQPLVATSCHNCGYVRFFNRNIVDWIIQQPVNDAEEVGNGD